MRSKADIYILPLPDERRILILKVFGNDPDILSRKPGMAGGRRQSQLNRRSG
ncbi:hypothetical protein [Desulfobacca acetoxidans]